MQGDYEQIYFRQIPAWLRGVIADKWHDVIAGIIQSFALAAKDAAKASLPEYCPVDALPLHGEARSIDPVSGESADAWRQRILHAWTMRETQHQPATFQDLMRFFTAIPGLYVFDYIASAEGGDDFASGASGSGEDGDVTNASRLAIVVEKPHGWVVPTIGVPAKIGPENLIGISMTRTELTRIRKYFRELRPAHIVGTEIWIIMDSSPAEDFPPDHTAGAVVRLALHQPIIGYRTSGLIGCKKIGVPHT